MRMVQLEKLALKILEDIKNGVKPDYSDYQVEFGKFGEALQFIDSNKLVTGITVKRAGAGKEIIDCSVDNSVSLTLPGFEFLEKNT
jgi:hypothetical protein